MRGLKRKLDDLQPAPGASGAAVLHERLKHIDGALLAPARAREAEKARERERELALLSGKTEAKEDKKEDGEGEAMEVEGGEGDAADHEGAEAEADGEAEDDDDKSKEKAKEEMAAAKARAKAFVAEHFEKRATSSTEMIRDIRGAADRTVDRYIVDHLLRTGRMKTARTLAAAQGIEVGNEV